MLTIQSPDARGDLAAYPLKKGVRAGWLQWFRQDYMATRTEAINQHKVVGSLLKP